jgi:DNA-binding MarR family transcriptional regulator
VSKQERRLSKVQKVSEKDRTIELLEELVKWTKVTSIPEVKRLLLEILSSPEEKIAYQSSNGETTGREVADKANVTQPTVAKWWKKWVRVGIAEAVSVRRGKRAKRLFSLNDFGIEVPTLEEATEEREKEGMT